MKLIHALSIKLFKLRLKNLESQKRSMVKRILKAIDQDNPDDYIQGLRDKLAKIDGKIVEL